MEKTITSSFCATIEEKKSKFIAYAYPISSEEDVKAHIQQLKKEHFKARHHCSAYRINQKGCLVEHSSDDGEPSGTAGRPMLEVLRHEQVNNILVVVVRYFGGIKLGTGGLARAYSQATKEVLNEAVYQVQKVQKVYQVISPYTIYDSLVYFLNQNHLYFDDLQYSDVIQFKLYIDDNQKNIMQLLQEQFLQLTILDVGEKEVFLPYND